MTPMQKAKSAQDMNIINVSLCVSFGLLGFTFPLLSQGLSHLQSETSESLITGTLYCQSALCCLSPAFALLPVSFGTTCINMEIAVTTETHKRSSRCGEAHCIDKQFKMTEQILKGAVLKVNISVLEI